MLIAHLELRNYLHIYLNRLKFGFRAQSLFFSHPQETCVLYSSISQTKVYGDIIKGLQILDDVFKSIFKNFYNNHLKRNLKTVCIFWMTTCNCVLPDAFYAVVCIYSYNSAYVSWHQRKLYKYDWKALWSKWAEWWDSPVSSLTMPTHKIIWNKYGHK